MTAIQRDAIRNLALLHQEATPEAIRAEVQRMERANAMRGCLLRVDRVAA